MKGMGKKGGNVKGAKKKGMDTKNVIKNKGVALGKKGPEKKDMKGKKY